MYNWKARIVQNAYWKQVAAEYDKNLPWHLPKVAATEEQIAAAERASGFSFPEPYKDFLRHANGWPGFYVSTDLFGTPDFISGDARLACERAYLQAFMEECGFRPFDYIAVGESKVYRETFVIVSPQSEHLPGGVIWYDSEQLDHYYGSFSDFFTDMIAHNCQVAEEVKGEGASSK